MRVSTIRFDRLKQSWELTKMTTAYINAERMIIENSNRGLDIIGNREVFEDPVPDFNDFELEDLSFGRKMTPIEEVWRSAEKVREKLDEAINSENYVKAEMLQNVLNGLEEQYNKLKNK